MEEDEIVEEDLMMEVEVEEDLMTEVEMEDDYHLESLVGVINNHNIIPQGHKSLYINNILMHSSQPFSHGLSNLHK